MSAFYDFVVRWHLGWVYYGMLLGYGMARYKPYSRWARVRRYRAYIARQPKMDAGPYRSVKVRIDNALTRQADHVSYPNSARDSLASHVIAALVYVFEHVMGFWCDGGTGR